MHLLILAVKLWLVGISGFLIFENAEANSYCFLEPEEGVCRAFLQRWFFNHTTKRCEKFIYGGCNGNNNNFESEKECQLQCPGNLTLVKPSAKDICFIRQVVGRCRAAFPRWHFDKKTGKCERFIYGGCNGNGNNFMSKIECEDFCQEFVTDPCAQPIILASKKRCEHEKKERRFGYNRVTKKCESFEYSSCKENKNNFRTRKSCLQTCAKDSACLQQTKYHRWRIYTSYFYSADKDICRETSTYFQKQNVWPKENRFKSMEDCFRECMPKHTQHIRQQT
ncbi:carboxypeptidase inhibitor SmCI-like [Dermacentor variabilis]|uniref:carboxypeptidase inhibitor SmCI-like n=1 Tax=Dermacentor variabilis TaxID=34621 RepID=UPI003F5BFD39